MMVIKIKPYGEFNVTLSDDGTMDTVIEVSGEEEMVDEEYGQTLRYPAKEIRFSCEYGAMFRDNDGAMTDEGFAELAEEAVEQYLI